MAIDLLGDRLNSGFCLKCGSLLMLPCNDYQCCSECTKYILEALNKFNYKRKKTKRMNRGVLVSENQIAKQIMPIGVPVN